MSELLMILQKSLKATFTSTTTKGCATFQRSLGMIFWCILGACNTFILKVLTRNQHVNESLSVAILCLVFGFVLINAFLLNYSSNVCISKLRMKFCVWAILSSEILGEK
jgi:hypothetical protein